MFILSDTERPSYYCLAFVPARSGITEGSILGHILFLVALLHSLHCITALSTIIDSHSINHHSFVDDMKLQMSASPDKITKLLPSMQSCISDIKALVTADILKFNDKIELMLVTVKCSRHLHNLPTSITTGNGQITFKLFVMNLDFTLDFRLSTNEHVSNIVWTC